MARLGFTSQQSSMAPAQPSEAHKDKARRDCYRRLARITATAERQEHSTCGG